MRALFLLAVVIGTAVSAQPSSTLDARAAQAIVAGCAAHASAKRQSEAIVVVDTGGHVIASLLMDGNSSGIYDFAMAKGQAAAAWGFSTAQMMKSATETPGFANAPHVVTVPGGAGLVGGREGADRRCRSLGRSARGRCRMRGGRSWRCGAALHAFLSKSGRAPMGGACRKSIRAQRPLSTGCCSTA